MSGRTSKILCTSHVVPTVMTSAAKLRVHDAFVAEDADGLDRQPQLQPGGHLAYDSFERLTLLDAMLLGRET
jgi:hypothetical protein